jgi:hypothetical protein
LGNELVIEPIVEGRDGGSHRGDPPDFPSIDVEDGLAADPALQERLERSGGVAPGGFELDLAVEAPAGHQRAESREVAGST